MITKKIFGKVNNQQVYLYTLRNDKLEVGISDFGGTIIYLKVLARNSDVVLGYDKLEDYFTNDACFGAVIAPNANRIGKGHVCIDGKVYQCEINNGVNNLHTHSQLAVNKMIMDVVTKNDELILKTHLADDRDFLPGERDFSVSYKLNDYQLEVTYNMVSDKKTVFNPTQHSYFNLDGHNSGDILEHQLKVNSSFMTPVDETLIPSGQIKDVSNSPFDFREFKAIGQDIYQDDQQLKYGNGYDHNYILDNYDGSIKEAAILKSLKNRLELHVLTNSVALQIYTANYVENLNGKDGAIYQQHCGIALETQYCPDCVNHDNFASSIINANKEVSYTTIFKFKLI